MLRANSHPETGLSVASRRWPKLVCLLLFFLPIAINVGGAGDKPIDLVPSDAVLLLLPTLLLSRIPRGKELCHRMLSASFVTIMFLVLFGLIGVVLQKGNLVPFLSATRAGKCFGQVFVGFLLFREIPRTQLCSWIRWSAFGVLVLVFISDPLFSGRFPAGRWAGNFLGADIYGFPNSSVFFLVALVPLAVPLPSESLGKKLISFACLIPAPAWIVMSLSRNGVVALATAIGIGSLRFAARGTSKLLMLLVAAFAVVLMTVVTLSMYFESDGLLPELPTSGLQARISRTFDSDDPSSGRFAIWSHAMSLIAERPFFGYFFEPFSNYNDKYDTPHSQYLEIIYKTGVVGFVIFFLPFVLMFRLARRLVDDPDVGATAFRIQIVLYTAWFSSLFQPNFSYPTFANFICLLGGLLAAWHFEIRQADGSAATESDW